LISKDELDSFGEKRGNKGLGNKISGFISCGEFFLLVEWSFGFEVRYCFVEGICP